MMVLGNTKLLREKLGINAIRVIVWAGINGAGGVYTLEDVGSKMDMIRIGDYISAIVKAISLATSGKLPEETPEATKSKGGKSPKNRPTKGPASTGMD